MILLGDAPLSILLLLGNPDVQKSICFTPPGTGCRVVTHSECESRSDFLCDDGSSESREVRIGGLPF